MHIYNVALAPLFTAPPKLRKPTPAKMWQPKPVLLLLLLAVSLCACTVASAGKPLVTAVTKDASTSLYTAPLLKDGHPLVLDLSSPIISSTTCHGTGSGDVTLSANATDGKNPLYPVSFRAVASCAPAGSLPAGAVGVAGLARSRLALPAQVASTQKVANKFMLCLPSDGKTGFNGNGVGVAIFGGGPFFLLPPDRPDITTMLAGDAPLHRQNGSPGYYISATNGIAVDGARVPLAGPLVIGLSSTIPYTELRGDVYRALVKAFDAAMGQSARITPAVAPFELCYDSTKLSPTLFGYLVPDVDLMLEGGQNFTVVGGNSMAQVNSNTACFAFVQMKAAGKAGQPAAVIGGFQMENKLIVFDEEKQKLGFTGLLSGMGYSCSNFNFTMAA